MKVLGGDQADFIASTQVDRAIEVNFNDYHEKGLFKRSNYQCTYKQFTTHMRKYKEGFDNALKVHVKLGFISETERNRLNGVMLQLTKRNDTGEDLLREYKIKF